MSAWGTGLFSDDTTCDVRDSYVKNLKAGLTDLKATEEILSRFSGLLTDTQVACLVYFALADTQWRYGRLDPHIKKEALSLLASGGDVHFWEQDAPADAAARKKVLAALRQRLESDPKPRRPIKVELPKPLRTRTDAELGTIFLLPLPLQAFAALVLVGHCDTGYKTMEPVFSVLNWKGKHQPSHDEVRDLDFVAVQGDELGPTTNIGFFCSDARMNPIADFVRTSIVYPDAPPYCGRASFTGKERMIARIESALAS